MLTTILTIMLSMTAQDCGCPDECGDGERIVSTYDMSDELLTCLEQCDDDECDASCDEIFGEDAETVASSEEALLYARDEDLESKERRAWLDTATELLNAELAAEDSLRETSDRIY